MILSQPSEIVKCEPKFPDVNDAAQEVKETPLRDAKHFLDELLDEYEDTDSREDDDRAEWGGQLGAARRRGLMAPPTSGVWSVARCRGLRRRTWHTGQPSTQCSDQCQWRLVIIA